MTKTYILGNTKLTRWANKDFNSYTLEKSYKDAQGEWQSTKSFGRDELLKIKVLIDKALEEDIKEFDNK